MTFTTRKDANVGTYELVSTKAKTEIAAGKHIVGVHALDFGQGDCNAIVIGKKTEPELKQPIIFCDVGGGKGPSGGGTHPWHASNPIGTKLNLNLCPTIIQSHWDADHYSTAVFIWQSTEGKTTSRKVPDESSHRNIYESCNWLVRRQRNGPSSTDFVRAVKNMVCWPENLPAHSFEIGTDMFVRVERCTGTNDSKSDRNLCGLAVRVINTGDERVSDGGSKKPAAHSVPQSSSSPAIDDEEDGDGDANSGDEDGDPNGDDHRDAQTVDPDDDVTEWVARQILLPGDAPFDYLPSHGTAWSQTNLTALFAYHHGSHTHLGDGNSIPKASSKGSTVVYTYGLKMGRTRCSYGHPHIDAVKAYAGKGWGEAEGHRHATAGTTTDEPIFKASAIERQHCFVPFESASSSPTAEADNRPSSASGSKPDGPTTASGRSVVIRRSPRLASK